jgi:hypothetical protein
MNRDAETAIHYIESFVRTIWNYASGINRSFILYALLAFVLIRFGPRLWRTLISGVTGLFDIVADRD